MSDLTSYLESLTVTQGDGAGGPLRLMPWQRELVAAVESGAPEIALSLPRGNAKSTTVSAIATAALDGPLAAFGGVPVELLDQEPLPRQEPEPVPPPPVPA